MEPFNGHIWNAFVILVPISVVVFVLAYKTRGKGKSFLFDPQHNADPELKKEAGTFGQHAQRYQELAKLVITLATASIGFLISTVVTNKDPHAKVALNLENAAPICFGFFGTSVALLISFMVLQTLWYEEYCHSAAHNTYKRWKYCTCITLGCTGLAALVIGFGWLAQNTFVR